MTQTTVVNPYLDGNSVQSEITASNLLVLGELPADRGLFVRNGPNPQFPRALPLV